MTTSKILLSLLATFVVFIIAACGFPSPPNSTNSPGSPVPFDTFLQQVAQAKYSDYAQLPTTKVQNAQAFEEMRTYTLNLYAGKQAISTYTINGQILLPDPGSPSTVQPH
ncbi:MAG TPA: hypothetical protein VFA10_25070 [Ktedonobacteraceae bacterium]|nr:hypothetical protein [Ktedonobacteraceae bacterium]